MKHFKEFDKLNQQIIEEKRRFSLVAWFNSNKQSEDNYIPISKEFNLNQCSELKEIPIEIQQIKVEVYDEEFNKSLVLEELYYDVESNNNESNEAREYKDDNQNNQYSSQQQIGQIQPQQQNDQLNEKVIEFLFEQIDS